MCFITLTFSCKSNKNFFSDLEKCTNKNLKTRLISSNKISNEKEIPEISLFDSIANFEAFLLKNKFLSSKENKDYLSLIRNLESNKHLKKEILDSMDSSCSFLKYVNNLGHVMPLIYDGCPVQVINRKAPIPEELIKMKTIYEEIFALTYPKTEHLERLILLETNFEDKIYRLGICNLIIIKLLLG
ncbi:hypothetical protein LG649_00105 [Tamlana sp. PT2-4]|uniref:Uncharacterized protein n=1 Tax=Neotamlana laminarinivorans TaxID=2883124 RepID=A0A9X1HWM8_9FLAO|nr:hypothetical protein [Tamlana laminarinivorans]